MTFKAQIKTWIGWDWNDGLRDNGRLEYAKDLAEGTGSNQADAAWHIEQQSLALGDSTTYDLAALERTIFGAVHTMGFAAVKAIVVINHDAAGGELHIGGSAEDRWSEPFGPSGDGVILPPDSTVLLSNRQSGWPVDAAAKNLRLTASGGDVTYSIAVVGTLTPGDPPSGSGV